MARRTSIQKIRAAVPSVEKALSIMEYLGAQKRGYSTTELSRIFKIPASTMNNLLYTLVYCGYLRRDEKGLFRLTMKLLGEAAKLIENTDLRDIARPELERLTVQAGLTSMLSIRDGNQLVCIDKVEGPSQIRIASSVGKHFCLHSTCTGKAILAYLPDPELDALVASAGLPRITPNTITSAAALKAALNRIRIQGYAADDEENTVGIRGIGAAIFDHDGRVVGAIAIGGVGFQLDDRITAITCVVKDCARAVSAKMGFRESTIAPPAAVSR
jgi:IclR family KDG regulon transcriptional repressor